MKILQLKIGLIIFAILSITTLFVTTPSPTQAAENCGLFWENVTRDPKQVGISETVNILVQPVEKNKDYSIAYSVARYLKTVNSSNQVFVKIPISFSQPGSYRIRAYQGRAADINNSERDCIGELTLTVTGTPQPSPPSDPENCRLAGFLPGVGGTRTVKQNETLRVNIDRGSSPPGDVFILKVNDQEKARTYGNNQSELTVSFPNTGTYTLTLWHQKDSQSFKCSGDLQVTVEGRGGLGSGQNPCTIGPSGECETALGNIPTNIQGFAGKILGIAIGLAGGLALILMVIGSVRVLTSSGDQQKLAGGRDMIVAAVAGLLFLIFSVLILKFIGVEILAIPGFG